MIEDYVYNNNNSRDNVKSPLYIDFSEGLNEELGFKHTMFHLSPVGFAP
jgi:hypothetical protein